MTKAVSNREICFIKAVLLLLLCEHGHFFPKKNRKLCFLPLPNTIRVNTIPLVDWKCTRWIVSWFTQISPKSTVLFKINLRFRKYCIEKNKVIKVTLLPWTCVYSWISHHQRTESVYSLCTKYHLSLHIYRMTLSVLKKQIVAKLKPGLWIRIRPGLLSVSYPYFEIRSDPDPD